jgi:hypothetical protein
MSKSKKAEKKTAAAASSAAKPKPTPGVAGPTVKPIVRAIRVSQELLDAAKAYKNATGTSFYRLGFEAIAERLKREGYLKSAEVGVGA